MSILNLMTLSAVFASQEAAAIPQFPVVPPPQAQIEGNPSKPVDISKPKPIFALTLSATVAPTPDFKPARPIPLVPVRLAVIYRSSILTFHDQNNLQTEMDPIETFALSNLKPEIPAGTRIPLPLYTDDEMKNGQIPDYPSGTPGNTYIRLSGQNIFNDNGYMSQELLILKENNCTIDPTNATCSIKIPSVQVLDSDSTSTKTVELKIFKRGSILRDNISKDGISFIPLGQGEQPEDYIRNFTRPDLADPRRAEKPGLKSSDLLDLNGTLYGYILYSKMTFSSDLQEIDVPVEVKENGYSWKSFQYSKTQSVGRIPLIPGVYLIERTLETVKNGQVKTTTDQAIVDLSKWGEFIPAENIIWTSLNAKPSSMALPAPAEAQPSTPSTPTAPASPATPLPQPLLPELDGFPTPSARP